LRTPRYKPEKWVLAGAGLIMDMEAADSKK